MCKDEDRSICFTQGIQSPTIARDMVLPLVVKGHNICIDPILQSLRICLALSWSEQVLPCYSCDNSCLMTSSLLPKSFLFNSVTTICILKV